MVWKSNDSRNNKQNKTYYQRLLPTHILSQLLHHHDSPELAASSVVPAPNLHTPLVALPNASQDMTYSSFASTSTQLPLSAAPAKIAYIPAKEFDEDFDGEEEEEGAGHDSPNWSKNKSFIILFGCTLLYSIIAEILVDTVDEVMENFPMDEKFLGLTLFALVPNITEFMNAISFALYGNIVLSMEIGSAYALQVCLLQIPAMVAFSIWYNYGKEELAKFTFR
jgi:Ca2+:H+ antiporter